MRQINILVIIITAFVSQNLQAQDSLAPIRDFITYGSAYQKSEMHLKLAVKNSSNIPVLASDTATLNAEIFLTSKNSYLRFENFEQLISDSSSLIVSKDQQRMILYKNAAVLEQQEKLKRGWVISDTSIHKMSKFFTGSYNNRETQPEIILVSKEHVNQTSFPKQEMKMVYNSQTKVPVRVVTITRTLVPENLVREHHQSPGYFTYVKLEEQSFVIKELKTEYDYQLVEYQHFSVPAVISERITQNESGEIVPVKAYENYAVTVY